MFSGLIRSMRPRQWPKNIFVFVPLLFDRKLFDPASVLATVLAFILFCLMSSAVYLMNDLVDIESDREHPVKRDRPLPSGQLSPQLATVAAAVLAVGSLIAAYLFSPQLAAVLLAYFVLQVAYTLRLKHVVLVDVMVIAAGFVLRIAAGVVVIDVVRFSPWLYVFGGFLALIMAIGKRRQELVLLGEEAGSHRAILDDYSIDLTDRMLGIVTTSSVVAYSLYTFLAEGVPENHAMMLTIPFVLYAVFRYLYLIHIEEEGGAPEEIVLRDRPFQVNLLLYGAMVVLALYVFA